MKKYIYRAVLAIILVPILWFAVWAKIYYHATVSFVDQINSNTWLTIVENSKHIIISPISWQVSYTLIFYPWAKVESQAYMYKLWSIALAHNITIIIDKPLAHLQIFRINNADSFMWDRFIIAGHSLWGAMACEYVRNHPDRISGMILMWAYCDSDISDLTWLQTLSFAAANDGLISPNEMKTYDHNLPPDHTMYILTWAVHAQYGNYGAQDGDGVSSISDDEVLQQLSDEIGRYISSLDEVK